MSKWKYLVRGYYADDVKLPKKPGDLAIEIGCANEAARDLEIQVLERRSDIGTVEWGLT